VVQKERVLLPPSRNIGTKAPKYTKPLVVLGDLVFWWLKKNGYSSHQVTKAPKYTK
jgi:hypothetical protein